MRRMLRWSALVALVGLVATAGRADAGQGASQWCSDNTPIGAAQEIHVIDDPVTFNLEVGTAPQYMIVCYSTTPFGSGAPAVTGGHVFVDLANGTANCQPDVSTTVFEVQCQVADPDPGSPGKRVTINVRFQGTTTGTVTAGVEVGTFGAPACFRGFTIFAPTTTVGPHNVGVC